MPEKSRGPGQRPATRRGTIIHPTTQLELKHDISPEIPRKSHDHNLAIANGVNLAFNTKTARARKGLYLEHAKKLAFSGKLKPGNWTKISIPGKQGDGFDLLASNGAFADTLGQHKVDFSIPYDGINVDEAGFWLSTPKFIKVAGENEYCWNGGLSFSARNTDIRFVWVDRIYTNPNGI